MKKYVFLTFAVTGVGGTQIYLRNKLKYLQSKGWDVYIFATERQNPPEKVYIKELEPYEKYITPELVRNPYIYSKKERNKIVSNIIDTVGKADEIVIESNYVQVTLWGELIAEKIHCRHFIFMIQENYNLKLPEYLAFYKFKLDRGELALNSKEAARKLFEGYVNVTSDPVLPAYSSNSIEDCESNFELEYFTDYNIGSLGRINKPFVMPMINKLIQFISEHNEKTFQVVFFGYSASGNDAEMIMEAFDQVENAKCVVTGPIYPVPYKIAIMMDVFISSSGAARATASLGIKTIAIDGNDYEPIGLFYQDPGSASALFREAGVEVPDFRELLEKALKTENISLQKPNEADLSIYHEHEKYLISADSNLVYYPIVKLRPKLITYLTTKLLGFEKANKLFKHLKSR